MIFVFGKDILEEPLRHRKGRIAYWLNVPFDFGAKQEKGMRFHLNSFVTWDKLLNLLVSQFPNL